MWVFFVLELLALSIVVTLLLRRYISFKNTPLYAYISTWIGWLMCFGIVCLVPLDIMVSDHANCVAMLGEPNCSEPLVFVSPSVLAILWKILYWGTFLLTWLVYPIFQSYALAGDFTILERMKSALEENILFYAIVGVAGLGVLVWLLAVKELVWGNVIGVLMAAANTWGIILLIALMGYGLVEIPRSLWTNGNLELTLRHYQFEAVSKQRAFQASKEELIKTLRLLRKYSDKIKTHDPFRPYIDIIISKCPSEYNGINVQSDTETQRSTGLLGIGSSLAGLVGRGNEGDGEVEIFYSKIVELHNKLKTSVHNASRSQCLYEQLLKRAFDLEDILASRDSSEKVIQWTFRSGRSHRFADYFEWFWFTRFYPPLIRLLALFFGLLSIVIIWSEVTAWVTKPDLSAFSWMVKLTHLQGIILQILVFLPLGYEALCAYSTLFKIKIFNFYRLIPHQQTDSNSIMFSAAYLCRLAAPLSFNFINFLHGQVETSFSKVLGNMDFVPFLGNHFSIYFPMITIIVCLSTLFNLYTKFLSCLKIKRFRFEDDFNDKQIDEGKVILAREREQRAHLPLESAFPDRSELIVPDSKLVSSTNTFLPSKTLDLKSTQHNASKSFSRRLSDGDDIENAASILGESSSSVKSKSNFPTVFMSMFKKPSQRDNDDDDVELLPRRPQFV